MKKIKNTDFGYYMAPLIKPMYVLQMARSKSWSAEARLRNVGNLRTACVKVIKRIDEVMETLCEAANREAEPEVACNKCGYGGIKEGHGRDGCPYIPFPI